MRRAGGPAARQIAPSSASTIDPTTLPAIPFIGLTPPSWKRPEVRERQLQRTGREPQHNRDERVAAEGGRCGCIPPFGDRSRRQPIDVAHGANDVAFVGGCVKAAAAALDRRLPEGIV